MALAASALVSLRKEIITGIKVLSKTLSRLSWISTRFWCWVFDKCEGTNKSSLNQFWEKRENKQKEKKQQ